MHTSRNVWLIISALVAWGVAKAHAQWTQQQFTLQAGWNAIFVELDPSPAFSADAVLVTQPAGAIELVRAWQPPGTSEIADAPSSDDTRWREWLPVGDPRRPANSTFRLEGGRAYLVKTSLVSPATATLTIVGTPSGEKTRLRVGQNLMGFHLDAGSTMTFGEYLSGSSAFDTNASLAGQQLSIYRVLASGDLQAVANPSAAVISPQTAYWVQSVAASEYDGPVAIDSRSLAGLKFGTAITEQRFDLENLTPTARPNLTITYTASDAAPAQTPSLAGMVPLSIREYGSGSTALFTTPPLTLGVAKSIPLTGSATPTGAQRSGFISASRAGLATALVQPDGTGSQYQGVITIRDGLGYRRWLAVTAEVRSRAGLYLGTVTLDRVQWVQADARILEVGQQDIDYGSAADQGVGPIDESDNDAVRLRPTPYAFAFPVIIHLDQSGHYKFLNSVTVKVVAESPDDVGRFVLATPSCTTCDAMRPGGITGGRAFDQRFATAAFSFRADLPMIGSFETVLSPAPIVVGGDDPINPFRHKFHPEHNADMGGDVYEITRAIQFDFTCPPEAGVSPAAGLGDDVLRGCYQETITGVHKRPITMAGRVELHKVSNIAVLNDGQ